jgi:aldose 1-epimerase
MPGVPREEWTLSLPARRRLLTDGRGIPTGQTVREHAEEGPLGRRRFDDGYDGLGPEPAFSLAGGGRSVTVRFLRGYTVAQVFAPCEEDVVCFEPMTAPTDALVTGSGLRLTPPGEGFRAALEVRVG